DIGDTERRGLGQATANVLINGERFAAKSTDVLTELRSISATNVQRIEIVDGATLNISGLSGQVANIVTVSRNGNAGPEIVFTPDGTIIDRRDEVLTTSEEQPRLGIGLRRAFD